MNDADAFRVAWVVHESAERFRRAMRDLETAPGVSVEERAEIATGLFWMADSAETADVDEENAGQRYANQVNAPLSRETLEALRAELQSEEYARFRKPCRREQENGD